MKMRSKKPVTPDTLFAAQLKKTKGDDLLDLKIRHDALPPPTDGDRDQRFKQGLMIEHALIIEFGYQYKRCVDERRAFLQAQSSKEPS